MVPSDTVYVITGPTASGKTTFSLEFARRHPVEIICMDSMQIFRGMDIGTAKPTKEEQALVKHHMLDIVDPSENYSVAEYVQQAEKTIDEIHARGHYALLVGGTGFYFRAMRHPMAMGGIAGDGKIRERLEKISNESGGKEKLHRWLEEIDPISGARLHVNDIRRVVRALEVFELTGRPISAQPQLTILPRHRFCTAVITMDRNQLYQRINQRVEQMITQGLPEEVERLLNNGVSEDAQSMKGIGYKEMVPYLKKQASLQETKEEIQKASRHYAKRQLTWMRREEDVVWIDGMAGNAYEKIEQYFMGENE